MKQLIVCSASDAHRLQNIVRRITVETTLLLSAGEADQEALSELETGTVTLHRGYNCDNAESRTGLWQKMKDLERVYFVVASAATGSCALRAMTLSLYPKLLEVDCWKITLESVKIPRGFAFARNLPEGRPYRTRWEPLAALLRRVQAALAA